MKLQIIFNEILGKKGEKSPKKFPIDNNKLSETIASISLKVGLPHSFNLPITIGRKI